MKKILFVTLEPISERMAGPAIRAVELGRQLSDEFQVTIFSPVASDYELSGSESGNLNLTSCLSKRKLYDLAQSCDIIYVQANVLKAYPKLSRLDKFLVVDLYDPILLSVLAQYADDPITSSASYRLMHHVLEKHMISADFCICASERQRDYWIGRFCAIGRLSPEIYRFDPSFRKVLDVVPFGLPAHPATRNGTGLKGQVAGIGPNDKVLLWGGGIWEWFDPLTVIEAVAKLSPSHPELKLFFMGWKSPNPQVPLMEMALKSKSLAQKLGVLDKSVVFHETWVPYEQRVNYLLDADIAVSAHFDLPETRFAFRTRMLDYLWAGLPVITTGGDQLAETIAARGAGIALPYKDIDAWSHAISRVLSDSAFAQQLRQSSADLSQDFVWNKAAEPLRTFCRNPHRLPPFSKLKMPSLVERARAVYARGGSDLILKRSKNLIEDILRR